jgi:predicted metalloprotease with PDZ domain
MHPIIRVVAACVALLITAASAAEPERLDYTLTPVLENGALTAIQFDLRFQGEADGETKLSLPNSWGGQDELYRGVEGLTVVSGAMLGDGEGPAQRVLTHRPNARIHVRYRVIQDWDGIPRAELGNTYRPVVQPTHFHIIGEGAFVAPEDIDRGVPVRVRVRDLPAGWSFASDLEHEGLIVDRLWSSVLVGGDFRVLRDPETNVRVAIRGTWSFADADFMREVSDIIGGQREFWGDAASPYLVTVLQLDGPEGWVSIGGTGLSDSFAFFATPNGPASTITRTLAHESLHSWIPAQIGGAPEEGEALSYWLSEGFTDFYTGRLLVRDGVWTPQQFATDLNAMLRAYAQSSALTEPNTRILADFWNDRDVQHLPYQRGRMLALIWDGRLRANGRSLDEILLEMRRRAQSDEDSKAADLFALAAPGFGLDISGELAANIENGERILLPEDLLAPCGRITTREVPVFHRGFDIEATQANNNVVSGVDPTLPAYGAGVRNGMTLIRRDGGEIGNSEQEIAYVLRDGETERTFRYMPRGHGSFTLQELELADDLEGERLAQCVRVLGGASS